MDSEKDDYFLPKDLKTCEDSINRALLQVLNKTGSTRLRVDLKFEGLRIVPIIIRTFTALNQSNYKTLLAFSDFGSAALARRDYNEYSNKIIPAPYQ